MSSAEELVRNRVVSIRDQPAATFVRSVTALALSEGGLVGAASIAAERWPHSGISDALQRAATTPTTTASGGAALVAPGASEFLGLVRPRTVAGRMPGLRRVPFLNSAGIATTMPTFAWVAEGTPIPVGKLEWTPASLPPRKAGGIVVASEELLKLTAPPAEALFRESLVGGLVQFQDTKFLSADAEVAGVSPAGVANGAVSTATAGNAAADLAVLLSGFENLENVVVVASEKTAIALAGQGAYRDGLLFGVVPVILSNAAGNRLLAIDQSRVLLAEDGNVTVDVARHAALQLDTAPTNPPAAATIYEPMWQRNLVGIRVLRWLNWQALTGSVRVVTGVTY
jgi:hypothetical protein